MNTKKILVSIAAWEDTHLIDTMNKIIKNSEYPERIVFGLGINYEVEPDFSNFTNTIKIVRDKDIANGKPGIVGIRQAIRDLVTDEEYFLGIDAHADFDFGWDVSLINDIEELTKNGEKIIISRQATPQEDGKWYWKTKWNLPGKFPEFGIDGQNIDTNIEYLKSKNLYINDRFFYNYYVSCNFIFAQTKSFKRINFPSYHRFPFEEPELSLAIYCSGYDVVAPMGDAIVTYAGNDIKYQFPYDERWWNFIGSDRNNPHHYERVWVLDDDEMTFEVKKLLLFGKNKYYSLEYLPRTHIEFYNAIGLGIRYWEIVGEALDQYPTLQKPEKLI